MKEKYSKPFMKVLDGEAKAKYETPVMQVIELGDDVITASGENPGVVPTIDVTIPVSYLYSK